MSQRDGSFARVLRGPTPRPAPSAEAIVAEALAERDPIIAVRAVAAGIARQTTGSQLACLRLFTEALVRRDPSLAAEIASELRSVRPAEGEE